MMKARSSNIITATVRTLKEVKLYARFRVQGVGLTLGYIGQHGGISGNIGSYWAHEIPTFSTKQKYIASML